ncbi:mechanosensitive ion channel family protein [Paraferrimonas sedimenticola]|uniref:Small-conductance mechanosensitive channel n=1 Tax=Paraferrimonas sedimenticola TaxID=375674 RepID=A0AA37RZ09_9GAMM|nr:mechanosensitive ion channel domain-containing protein [Paraferrimonas sedimenticola]GLP97117.1 mechanosensitive ion channel protein [Paraferrimonas sedimenticola]
MEQIQKYAAMAPDLAMVYGTKVLLAIAIFVVGRWVARWLSGMFSKVMTARQVDQTVVSFVGNIVYALLLTFVVIAALSQVGIQTASLVAIIGAAGLAVGLALQGSLSNFAAGVLLVIFKPCKVGDFVEAAGVSGSVDEITIFSTKLRTPDNKIITVANAAVMGDAIVNYSAMPTRRLDLVVGVSYDADIKQTKEILEDILNNHPAVLKDPAYTVALAELADSSVNFVVRPWVNTGDYWSAKFEINEQVKTRLDEAGIGIPYPQMDVHIQKAEA